MSGVGGAKRSVTVGEDGFEEESVEFEAEAVFVARVVPAVAAVSDEGDAAAVVVADEVFADAGADVVGGGVAAHAVVDALAVGVGEGVHVAVVDEGAVVDVAGAHAVVAAVVCVVDEVLAVVEGGDDRGGVAVTGHAVVDVGHVEGVGDVEVVDVLFALFGGCAAVEVEAKHGGFGGEVRFWVLFVFELFGDEVADAAVAGAGAGDAGSSDVDFNGPVAVKVAVIGVVRDGVGD